VNDRTTKLVHLGNTRSAAAEMTLERHVFWLAQRVQHVATAVLVYIEGTLPGSHNYLFGPSANSDCHKVERLSSVCLRPDQQGLAR
jgi:hypothetical protein